MSQMSAITSALDLAPVSLVGFADLTVGRQTAR